MSLIQQITDSIEAARLAGELSNDAARVASVALTLTGDDAMLANRIIAQGADPASLDYLVSGSVSESVAQAHRNGPGALEGEDRRAWLRLAALSANESKRSTLRSRVLLFAESLRTLGATGSDPETDVIEAGADRLERDICNLNYALVQFGALKLPTYTTDLGFAAAYWCGLEAAAVIGSYDGAPYVAVGSKGTPLTDLNISVDKLIAPCFGIIENPERVADIQRAAQDIVTYENL